MNCLTEIYHIKNVTFTGAFLLVYAVAMFFCGVPIFFQEVAIGQYLGSGGMTLVAQLCPMLKVSMLVCLITSIKYNLFQYFSDNVTLSRNGIRIIVKVINVTLAMSQNLMSQ